MKKITTSVILFFVSLLLLQCNTAEPDKEKEQEKKTIVEGNHFYSNYQLNTTYVINQVSTSKSIILILKKKDDQVFDNAITIGLISGDSSVQCKFDSFDGLCFLNKLPSSEMKMKLRCDHLPCQVSWTIWQPSTKKLQEMQSIEQMYEVDKSDNHMIAMVTCNNPDIKDFDQLVSAYSENSFTRGSTNNIIYLLFKKRQAGHLYFVMQPEARACAQLAIYHVDPVLEAEKEKKDFVLPDESSVFKFGKRPEGQFRFDFGFHEMSNEAISSSLLLTLTGQKSGIRQTILSQKIQPSFPTTQYQFSLGIPTIPSSYTNIQLSIKSDNKKLILNYYLSLKQEVQIEETEHSHFYMKKGQKLKFKLIQSIDASPGEILSFFVSQKDQVQLSRKECSKKAGCYFQVQAKVDTSCVLYVGKNQNSDVKGDVKFVDFKGRITKKIKDSEKVYLRTPMKQNQVIRVVVNNPNVIIRASSQEKCTIPNQKCYEHIANSHHHFIYEPKKDVNLLMEVLGLDICQFTVSVISEGYDSIELHDGEPFSYLMDESEKKIYFKFTLPQKTAVSFNLISPLNDLRLIVNNGQEKPNGEQHTPSSDGYISYAKEELESKEFRILVEKTSQARRKSVHFSLIASTKNANLRLDPGLAHTQSLKPDQSKDFVFQFDKKGDYILNFYTPSIDRNELKIKILINNEDKWKSTTSIKNMQITQNSDVLNLRDISQQLCIEEGDTQCQIFLRISNDMDIEIDITLTLLVKDSVIQLKDGLWQTYAINTVAKTSNFYFLPSAKNSSVSIMYKSSLVDIGISYSIWKSDKDGIDPVTWPFPRYKENVTDANIFNIRSVSHILIDTENLKACWPSCVILLSLYRKKGNEIIKYLDPNNQGNFSIMASNKIFQLPQKQKTQLFLKKSQQKYMLIDLKQALQKQSLTFFTNLILGSYSLYASLYSQKNPHCPTIQQYDFNFGSLQTQIKIQSIINKIQQYQMQDHHDLYLCIIATAYDDTKFTIQYTSEQDVIQVLDFDSFQGFALGKGNPRFYQLPATQLYEIKFVRENGYFYVKISVCKDEEGKDFEQCLEDLRSSQDRGQQVITKTQQFTQQPCQNCIVFIRLDTDDYSQGTIHVQSQYSLIQLKQNIIITDFTNNNQTNHYSITSIRSQQTIISISVTQGDPIVQVTDFGNLTIRKEKNNKTNAILISIPSEEDEEEEGKGKGEKGNTGYGDAVYSGLRFSSTFREFVVTVSSKDNKTSAAYSLFYSSDGLPISTQLTKTNPTSFLYKNPNQLPDGYLSISMNRSSALYNLNIKIYTLIDPNDEQTKTEIPITKPPMRKNTANPTIIYNLPVSKLVMMELQLSGDGGQEEEKVTLMVVHRELVILLFGEQFPFQMHENQSVSFMADVNNPGYLLVSLRKCDQSSPDFGYTFSYTSFQNNQFQYTTTLAEDPKFQFFIKVPKIGPIYLQMNTTGSEKGLFAISMHYSDIKIKGDKSKPGRNGIIQYFVKSSKWAQIKFHSVVCASGNTCAKDTRYFWMLGSELQDVYTQTVCPFSFFQVLGITSKGPLKINEIKSKPGSDGIITFNLPIQQPISYLSIKAVSGTQQVYYQPLEIETTWGTVTRTSIEHSRHFGLFIVLLLIICLICYRRKRRIVSPIHTNTQKYTVLPDEQHEFD